MRCWLGQNILRHLVFGFPCEIMGNNRKKECHLKMITIEAILYFATNQFVVTCNNVSFATSLMTINHLWKFYNYPAGMPWLHYNYLKLHLSMWMTFQCFSSMNRLLNYICCINNQNVVANNLSRSFYNYIKDIFLGLY